MFWHGAAGRHLGGSWGSMRRRRRRDRGSGDHKPREASDGVGGEEMANFLQPRVPNALQILPAATFAMVPPIGVARLASHADAKGLEALPQGTPC